MYDPLEQLYIQEQSELVAEKVAADYHDHVERLEHATADAGWTEHIARINQEQAFARMIDRARETTGRGLNDETKLLGWTNRPHADAWHSPLDGDERAHRTTKAR